MVSGAADMSQDVEAAADLAAVRVVANCCQPITLLALSSKQQVIASIERTVIAVQVPYSYQDRPSIFQAQA